MPGIRLFTLLAVVLIGSLPAITQAGLSDKEIADLQQRAIDESWTFTVGPNPATERSLDELGGLRVPDDWQSMAPSTSFERLRIVPERFDWRDSAAFPVARDQAGCGSCWAFATVGPLELNIAIREGDTVDLSEQWLVSCNSSGYNCSGGWWVHDYHMWDTDPCDSTGAVLEADFPYAAQNLPCDCPYPHQYYIRDWAYIETDETIPDPGLIKQAILDYGPVSVGISASPELAAYTGGVFNYNNIGSVNHAVVVVGWDDSQGTEGIWFARNSWGPDWGEDGYVRIEYGCSRIGYAATYVDYYPSNPDVDGDGVLNPDDNCLYVHNPDQSDSDTDGKGDACDECPYTDLNDPEDDDVCNDIDNCPAAFNPDQADSDGDGIGDACDNCVHDYNPSQDNVDGDAFGDLCDPCLYSKDNDWDGDGLCADADNCPDAYNPDQTDTDGDGIGDACTYVQVTAVSPAANAGNVALDASIEVTFDAAIDESTLNDTSFAVCGMSSGKYSGLLTYDPGIHTVSFTPEDSFHAGEQIEVRLSARLLSGTGPTPLAGFTSSFMTEVGKDCGWIEEIWYPTGIHSNNDLEAVDMNGDGLIDFVTANGLQNSVTVNLNLGDGTYSDFANSAGIDCRDVAAADYNLDGNPDVATVGHGTNDITIRLNDGNGRLRQPTYYPADKGPVCVVSDDVDADGYPDLITSSTDAGSVAVYLNNQDGTFRKDTVYQIGRLAYRFILADFNLDNRNDIAITIKAENSVAVLFRNGKGYFEPPVHYMVGRSPCEVIAADFDYDGDPDLATANYDSGDVTLLFNDGTGAFYNPATYPVGTGPEGIAASDFDGDGFVDLFVTNRGSCDFYQFRNDGTGVFSTDTVFSLCFWDNPQYTVLKALDMDGDLDVDYVIGAHTGGSLRVLRNRTCHDIDSDGFADPDVPGSNCPNDNCPEHYNPDQADDDADGIGDVCDDCRNDWVNDPDEDGLCGIEDNCPLIHNPDQSDADSDGIGDACECSLAVQSVAPSPSAPSVAADTDIEIVFSGDVDWATVTESTLVVTAASTGRHDITVSIDPGDQTVTITPTSAFAPGELVTAMVSTGVRDISGLLYLGGYTWSFTIAAGPGPGEFPLGFKLSVFSQRDAVMADFNSDGALDIATAAGATVYVMLNPGDGQFETFEEIGFDGSASGLASGDLDNDGDIDLVVQSEYDNAVFGLINDGFGTFALTDPAVIGDQPIDVAVLDVDCDGFNDVLCSNLGSSDVTALMNNGRGYLGMPRSYPVENSIRRMSVADVNLDGLTDVVICAEQTDSIIVLINRAGSLFDHRRAFWCGDTPKNVAIGDIDADGDPDIVTCGYDTKSVYVLRNDGAGWFDTPETYLLPSYAAYVSLADIEGDSDLDFMVSMCTRGILLIHSNDGLGNFTLADTIVTSYTPISSLAGDLDLDGDLDVLALGQRLTIRFNAVCVDSDGDGYGDPDHPENECPTDNCPFEPNDDQTDTDGDGIGDVCDDCCGLYTGGQTGNIDFDEAGKRNLADISKLIDRVYISKTPLTCEGNGDTNGDTKINLADISRLIDHVYLTKQETEPCP